MKDSKHTPGPWIASGSAIEDVDITEIRTPDERLLAEVLPYDTANGLEEMDANARLIAAAPDLLHTCTQVLATIEAQHEHTVVDNGRMMKLRAAIAKATGQH